MDDERIGVSDLEKGIRRQEQARMAMHAKLGAGETTLFILRVFLPTFAVMSIGLGLESMDRGGFMRGLLRGMGISLGMFAFIGSVFLAYFLVKHTALFIYRLFVPRKPLPEDAPPQGDASREAGALPGPSIPPEYAPEPVRETEWSVPPGLERDSRDGGMGIGG